MENLEITGKTVEEATKKALTRLNVGLDEVEITVLNEGRSGILGIGSEEARIRVKLIEPDLPPRDDSGKVAEEVLHNILDKMGLAADVIIEQSAPLFDDTDEPGSATINVSGEDLGVLIGRRGQTLDALQYLVRLIVSKQTNVRAPVIIDVENYKRRRLEDLKTLALNVAEQVKSTKSSIKLEPMSPFERRVVHMTLADDPDVVTESVGEGEGRKVMVLLRESR
jgi:spoIIIJ-associated protein